MVHSWVVGGVCERVVGVGGGRHETGKDRMGGEGRGLLQRSERGRRKRASAESVGRERRQRALSVSDFDRKCTRRHARVCTSWSWGRLEHTLV